MRRLRARQSAEKAAQAKQYLPDTVPLLPLPPVAEKGIEPPTKRARDWKRHLLSRYHSPLTVLAEICSRPVDKLAGELQCSRLDAIKIQRDAAKELLPYLHARVSPDAVAAGGTTTVNVYIDKGLHEAYLAANVIEGEAENVAG